ncbi:MAG: PD-(D/E)XK motif protein [Rhodocyclaceae bacterium]|nr:PD-(D/E)XK motif protein [Rhodocyclaceae bacterium]
MINTRRVSSEHRRDFFWGKDHAGRCLLVLSHADASAPEAKLPRPRGLGVELTPPFEGRKALILKLLDSSQRDIFLKLAHDIIDAAEAQGSEVEAVAVALARTWRWHHLLKGGGGGKLGDEEQKGLIGELLVLKRHLIPRMPHVSAVDAWKGPLGAPKDFEIGRLAIEAKARRGAAAPFIAISSEYQLDASGCDCLLLHVVELDKVDPGAEVPQAMSIASLASEIRQAIDAADRTAIDIFDASLASRGVVGTEEYEDDVWIEGRARVFEVREGFPRITPAMTGGGVKGLRYSVDLSACEPFAVLASRIDEELGGQGHVQHD